MSAEENRLEKIIWDYVKLTIEGIVNNCCNSCRILFFFVRVECFFVELVVIFILIKWMFEFIINCLWMVMSISV